MEKHTEPSLAVIIPIYKVEMYLKECIDSVLQQNLESCHLYLVNDASPDGSLAIAQQYATQYPDLITVIDKPVNEGLSAARNTGLETIQAQGRHFDFIYFLDSDDVVMPGALKEILSAPMAPQTQLIVCNFKHWFGDNSTQDCLIPKTQQLSKEAFCESYFTNGTHDNVYPFLGNKIFAYDFVKDRRFDTSVQYAEDYDYIVTQIIPTVQHIVASQTFLLLYRARKSSLSNTLVARDTTHTFEKFERLLPLIPQSSHALIAKSTLSYRKQCLFIAYNNPTQWDPRLAALKKAIRHPLIPLKTKLKYYKFFLPSFLLKPYCKRRLLKDQQRNLNKVQTNQKYFA